jgi:transcriptional regulator with PAS, ATPase and Fis domain
MNSPTLNSADDRPFEIELIVKSLLKANSAWHNILRVLPVDDIMVTDDHGAVCHVGENVAGLTGFSVEEIINNPVSEVLTSWSGRDYWLFALERGLGI